jgi:O-antigen/teichoic acid export membrane protein
VGGSILRYAPSRLIDPALGILAIPILARVLEPQGYGDFKTVILTVGLLRILSLDWVNNCAIRFLRPMENDLSGYYSNLLAGSLMGAAVAALACTLLYGLFASPVGSDGNAVGLLVLLARFAPWMLLAAVADGFVHNGEMTLRAMHRPLAFSMVRVFAALSRHGLGLVLLLLFSRSFFAYLGGWTLGAMVLAILVWRATGGWRHISVSAVSPGVLGRFAVFGFPLTLVLLANTMQTTGTRYVLQWFAGSEATGLFSAAYDLGGVPVTVFQSIVMLGLYPLAIDAHEKHGNIDFVVRDGLRYFLLGATPVVLLLALLAGPAITVFAGADYAVAWPVLSICCIGTFAYGFSQYFSLWFLVAKKTGRWAFINLSAAAANIVLAMFLVPRFGYVAAAWTTAMAHLLILIGAMIWGVPPNRSRVPLRTLVRSLSACVPIVAIWFLMQNWFADWPLVECLVIGLSSGAAYLLVLAFWGELKNELAYLRKRIFLRSHLTS